MTYQSDLQNLSDAAVGAVLAAPTFEEVPTERHAHADSVILINKNTNLIDLDQFADGKRRKTGEYTTHSVADFVRFVKDETTPEDCKIFVNADLMKATAFLNYGAKGFEQGKLDYKAVIELKMTPVFQKLVNLHHNTVSQRDLIDFLTDYAPVLTPVNSQGETINIGNAINALRQIKIDETKNTQNDVQNFGETRSTFENVKARTADDNMPVIFEVDDACYQSLPKTEISLRLVIKAVDGKPFFKLMINAIDLLQLERAETFVKMINNDLAGEFDVLLGGFNA